MKNKTTKILGAGLVIALTLSATAHIMAQGNGNEKRNQQELSQEKNNDQAEKEREKARDKAEKNREKAQDKAEKDREKAGDKAEKQREKANDRAEKRHDQVQDKAENDRDKAKDKAEKTQGNNGRGNAYGRNKGELSGREFGQARAADARAKNGRKKEDLDKVVVDGDKKVKEAKEKISRSKTELDEKRKAGKITDAEYREKQEQINRAERAVFNLEEKVNSGRQISVTIQ